MAGKHQVIFRESVLNNYPFMKDYFDKVCVSERAKGLLAAGEALASIFANIDDTTALYPVAEAIRKGCIPPVKLPLGRFTSICDSPLYDGRREDTANAQPDNTKTITEPVPDMMSSDEFSGFE